MKEIQRINLVNIFLACMCTFFIGFVVSYNYILFQQNSWSIEMKPFGNKELKTIGTNFCKNMGYDRIYDISNIKNLYAKVTCTKINSTNQFVMSDFDFMLNEKN